MRGGEVVNLIEMLAEWTKPRRQNGKAIRARVWDCARDLSDDTDREILTACDGFRAPAQEIIVRLASLTGCSSSRS